MAYKQKLYILSALAVLLAAVYALTYFFDPQRSHVRDSTYAWLDSKLTGRIDRIEIRGTGDEINLLRKADDWYVSHNGREYPGRVLRIDDFIKILTNRAVYPVRASSASSHERLGVGENSASRVIVHGGAGLPMLDLLIGNIDNTGTEVYLRRAGQNEVRSGEDKFSGYLAGRRSSWYQLRLFSEGDDSDSVQRLSLYTNDSEASGGPQVFTRDNSGWTIRGLDVKEPDTARVDSYIRGVLSLEGDDFTEEISASGLDYSRLTLEFGDGTVKALRLSAPDESGRRFASAEGSPLVYTLAPWAAERIFKNAEYFEK
jgi:hypothetical protein